MKTRQALDLIEQIAPPAWQAPWDASGIQIAARTDEVRRLAVMLDPVAETVEQALDWGADLMLSHHPLTLKPRLPASLDNYHNVLRLTLCAEAWLYAAHTSLDTNANGPVSWLAQDLELTECQVIDPIGGEHDEAGYGTIGNLPTPVSLDDFFKTLSKHVKRSFCTLCGPRPDIIRRVGICPGSGSSLAEAAFALNADVFVTGDMKYHQAQEAPGLIIDVGHFSLEEEMMRRLAASLDHQLAHQDVDVRFFPGQDPFEVLLSQTT
jgi:dinuclear metal center YbgI/SA1388 family protein